MKLYLLFFIQFVAHTIFDVVVDDEVELLFGKTVMYRQNLIYLVYDGFGEPDIVEVLGNFARLGTRRRHALLILLQRLLEALEEFLQFLRLLYALRQREGIQLTVREITTVRHRSPEQIEQRGGQSTYNCRKELRLYTERPLCRSSCTSWGTKECGVGLKLPPISSSSHLIENLIL